MKTLLNQSDSTELAARINKLSPDTQHQWGKMNAAQMLAHVHVGLRSASGELKLKRSLMGIFFGNIAKKKLTSDEPWGKNMPTDKHFVVADHRNFEEEKKAILTTIQRFSQAGASGVSNDPHPFFGKMTPEEWGRLMWKHLDHHLNQFGV
jgi:hypothetical protein